MGFSELFTDIITKLETIQDPKPVTTLQKIRNYQKTESNRNQRFKVINIWNDQIDNEVKEKENYVIKCPAIFLEFIPEEPKMILGGVTQYPDAKMYFHIFSDQLNSPNSEGGDFMDRNIEIYSLRDDVKSIMLGFHTHNSSFMMSRYDALDYKHKTITKYLLGFSFCFNDDKGSIFDPKSSRYLVTGNLPSNLEVLPRHPWVSEDDYLALCAVVFLSDKYYLCITSNSDEIFNPLNWLEINHWVSGTTYSVGNYIYEGYFCYQCLTGNSDTTFNPNNWVVISRL